MSHSVPFQQKSVERPSLSSEAKIALLHLEVSRLRQEIHGLRCEMYGLRQQLHVLATKLALYPEPARLNWLRPARPAIARVTITTSLDRPQFVTSYDARGKEIPEYTGTFESVGVRVLAQTQDKLTWEPIREIDRIEEIALTPTLHLPITPIPETLL